MEQSIKEERSKQIWGVRSLAILSVCCAHMPMDDGPLIIDHYLNQILGMIGTLGVGGFLICSGYYFSVKEAKTFTFWKRKVWKLIIPWLLLGAATKMWINHISNIRPLLKGYIPWVMGQKTWMYFVPVLIALMIIFTIFHNKYSIYILSVLSIASNVIVICGYGYGKVITPHMNPFNWALFFALGLIWQYHEEKIMRLYRDNRLLVCGCIGLIFGVTVILYIVLDRTAYYWTWLSLPFELSGIIILLVIAYKIRNCRLLQDIGRNTLFIFMIHMIIAGGVMNHLPSTGIIAFVRPIVTLGITYVGTLILRVLLSLCHVKQVGSIFGVSEL